MAFDPYYANVGLLLHCNGTDGSTTFTDNSPSPKTVTVAGNAQIDTAQSKWGGASGLFDGTGDYISVPDSVDLEMGSGNFTIELWVRLATVGTFQSLVIKDFTGSGFPSIIGNITTAGKLRMAISSSGSGYVIDSTGTTVLSTNTWYHVAYVRNGSTFTGYLNGSPECSGSTASALFDSTNRWTFGALDYVTPIDFLNGWLDDIRITKGVARYTTAFSIPTEEFPNSGPPVEPVNSPTIRTPRMDLSQTIVPIHHLYL